MVFIRLALPVGMTKIDRHFIRPHDLIRTNHSSRTRHVAEVHKRMAIGFSARFWAPTESSGVTDIVSAGAESTPKFSNFVFFFLTSSVQFDRSQRCCYAVESPGIGKRWQYFVRFRRSTCLFWRSTILASWVHFLLAVIWWWSRDEATPNQTTGRLALVGWTVLRSFEKSNFAFAGINRQCTWSSV